MKNNKIILFSILISCIFILTSCSGLSEKEADLQENQFTVSGSISIEKASSSALRAAYPSFDLDEDISWTVVAKNDNPLFPDVIADCKENASFSVVLTTEGKWSFYAMGKINEKVVLQNTSPVEVTAKNVEGAWVIEPSRLTIPVYPVFLETESGSVKLYFHSSTREYRLGSIKYDFTDQAVESGTITFNDNGIAEFSLENVPAGMHNVKFTFFEEERERELYSFTETLIVFSGAQTDTWQENNSESDDPNEIDYTSWEIKDELIFGYQPEEEYQSLDNPIVLWNYRIAREENTTGDWSNRTGYAVFSQISDYQIIDYGQALGKNMKYFCFDQKNGKIYGSEKADAFNFLFAYPTYAGYSTGKLIPCDTSLFPACIYDGNVWFKSSVGGTFVISKLENGKLENYSTYNSEGNTIDFSSSNNQSINICADANYLYALCIVPDKHVYGGYTYTSDYSLELRKFAVSESEKKLTCLAELSLTLTDDFDIPAPAAENQNILSNLSINDIMLVEDSASTSYLYVLLAEDGQRGGIVKFESRVSDGNHTLRLEPIDKAADAPKLYGWWYYNNFSEDIADFKTLAQEIYELNSSLNYTNRFSSISNVFVASTISTIPIAEDIASQEALVSKIQTANEIIERIKNAVTEPSVLTVPIRFIARRPDELIIAEDAGNGSYDNRNSVYSLNLKTLTATRKDVNVGFDSYCDSGWHPYQ